MKPCIGAAVCAILERMKIYATSDVHGNLDGLDPTAAGTFTANATGWTARLLVA